MPAQLEFPLSFLAPLLAGFTVSAAVFDPKADWTARYRTHCLVGNVTAPNGSIVIERSAVSGGSVLRVRRESSAGTGRIHVVSGEVHCAADTLATPLTWSVTGDAAGVRGARLRTSSNGDAGKLRGPLSHEWSLLDAIQRLPRKPFPALAFRLLTRDGALLPDHTLTYRGALETETGLGNMRLHGYEHLGGGILPWLYFTSDSGKLLIAVSGLEAWLRDETKP